MITSITLLFLLCLFLLMPDEPFTDRVAAEEDHHYDQLYLESLYLEGKQQPPRKQHNTNNHVD